MVRRKRMFFYTLAFLALLSSGCEGNIFWFQEIRTELFKTNIIGIAGETALEPYIEIQYSIKDETKPGYNKTASIWVTPPYVFKNENVYITYKYVEEGSKWGKGPTNFFKLLIRDYEEGGAEFLRIINHSSDKPVEFFLAGAQMGKSRKSNTIVPWVCYKNAPVYFLLYPDKKYTENAYWNGKVTHYFEGDRIGDLIVTEAWTVDEVAALYRAEYAYSNTVQLTLGTTDRLMDYINGIDASRQFRDSIFYGSIQPGEEFRGNERLWLLTALPMFESIYDSGSLPYVEREW